MIEMSIITEMIARGWENFLARPTGPFHFRFVLQPAIASLLALRAGIKDAKQGAPAYLWAALTSAEHRSQLLRSGWKDVGTPILVGAILDSVYQLIVHRFIYPIELLFTVILLVVMPYLLLRGPISRLVLPIDRTWSGSIRRSGQRSVQEKRKPPRA